MGEDEEVNIQPSTLNIEVVENKESAFQWLSKTWSGSLQGRPGSGCSSYGEENHAAVVLAIS